MIFHLVETLAASPFFLFLCGCGLTVVPFAGIMFIHKTMSLIQKFKKDVSTLRSAANGEIYLDVKNPKLYKKVRRFYENEGVVFSGDPLDDYEMLMEYVASDLEAVEA